VRRIVAGLLSAGRPAVILLDNLREGERDLVILQRMSVTEWSDQQELRCLRR